MGAVENIQSSFDASRFVNYEKLPPLLAGINSV